MEKGDAGISIVVNKAWSGARPGVKQEIQGFAKSDPNRPVAVLGGILKEGNTFEIDTANATKRGIGAARKTIKAALQQGAINALVDNATRRTGDGWKMYKSLKQDEDLEVKEDEGRFVVRLREKPLSKRPFWQRILGL